MVETQHSRAAVQLLHKPPQAPAPALALVPVQAPVQAPVPVQAPAQVAAASIRWNPQHCPQQVSTVYQRPDRGGGVAPKCYSNMG